ncbi:MAG: MerC domain-containing protein [Chitinophagaceae bacterium]|nr:MerC domain-containing protein [Bacteroidota bacterium]MCC6258328.1 MerC domain-containing protein [Chitinophagaceae bacterium]MCW5916805.1 MerC domain-containing protein [Ferruginibacter sp.]
MAVKINWDSFGIATSLACAIHCAILPLALTSLPLFGINIIHNAAFEWGMIALAFSVGAYSLLHGYFVHHRTSLPILIFSGGFLFLVLKQVFHSYEVFLLIPAVLLIIYGHLLNYKTCNKFKCSSPHHKH